MKLIPIADGRCAIVDNDDYELLNQYKWHVNAQGYLSTRIYTGTGRDNNTAYFIRMHRLVMNAPDDMVVDHIFGKKFDNRKTQLRLATGGENNRNRGKQTNNTSGHKGVSWHKKAGKWTAQIDINHKHHYLGLFTNLEDATEAYKQAATKYHGEFACV